MSLVIPPTRAAPATPAPPVRPDVVQAVGRRSADVSRRPRESAAIFVCFGVLYSVVGHWLVVDLHLVGFEALDRFGRGLMVVQDGQPVLAAIGPDYPPLSVLLVAPFAVVASLTGPLAVVPVVSATFAALTLVVVNTMLRRARIALPMRLAVLAALGLNPLVVMYASLGARSFLWLAFVVAALGALVAWYVTADVRFVMLAGLAFAVASLAGYGSLLWFLVSLVVVAAVLTRLGAGSAEVEGTVLGLASPTVFAVTLWSVINLIVLGSPLDWLTESGDSASGLSFAEVVRATGELVLFGSPIALVVLPALVYAGVAHRNGFALWLGVLLLVSILAPGLAALTGVTATPMVMSNALPILLVSVVGAIWLARSAASGRGLVAGGLVLGLLISMPFTFAAMETFDRQGLERAFHAAVATGESQEGATTVDGSVVGYGDEQAMADWITDHVDDDGSILTDDAQTYAVVMLTGDPGLFVDRVDASGAAWRSAADDPADHVDYLLLSTDPTHDLLSERFPEAAAGTDPVLRAAAITDRYVLVEVPDDYEQGDRPTDPVDADATDEGEPVGGVDGILGEAPPEEVGVP